LTVTVGGVTGNFPGLSSTTLGWTAGAGLEVALWSKWSAKLEYLYVSLNGLNSTVRIPGNLGVGTAFESGDRRDNIVRVGLNYRFGPRGGPGVLETAPLSPSAYALNYDFLPSAGAFADRAKPAKQQAAPALVVTADAAPEASSIAIQQRPAIAIQQRPAKPTFKDFADIGALEDTETTTTEPPPLNSSKKRQAKEKEEDESQRLKRIMSICAGC
jgi:Outer membrane protein beta-barrel domain